MNHQGQSSNCLTCGGLILERNKTYGYAGPVCSCLAPATHQQRIGQLSQQNYGLDSMSVPQSTMEILARLDRIEAALRTIFDCVKAKP